MNDDQPPDCLEPIPQATRPRAVRWKIIPGTFLAIFAVIGMLGSIAEAVIVMYYNTKFGWIRVDPEAPSLSQLAITPLHVLRWQCGSWGFIAAGFAAYGWFYGKQRIAWVGTAAFFALMAVGQWIDGFD